MAVDLDAGLLVYNASAAATCLAAIQTINCSVYEPLSDPSCATVLSGAVATGGACDDDLDCKAGYCLGLPDGGCGGTCTPYLQLGADSGPMTRRAIRRSNATCCRCQSLGANGAACDQTSYDYDCISGNCDATTNL